MRFPFIWGQWLTAFLNEKVVYFITFSWTFCLWVCSSVQISNISWVSSVKYFKKKTFGRNSPLNFNRWAKFKNKALSSVLNMQLKITVPQLFRGRERKGGRDEGKQRIRKYLVLLNPVQIAERMAFPQIMEPLETLNVPAAIPHRGFPKI